MIIETDAIQENGFFDARYTCDIDNSSPELRWRDPPEAVAGYSLVVRDVSHLDEKCHWVVFNIPSSVLHLPAGIPPQEFLPNGIRQGLNDWGKLGYAGPCPPPQASHDYRIEIFALRALPEIAGRPNRRELMQAIGPYVIASAQIVGRYQRSMQIAG